MKYLALYDNDLETLSGTGLNSKSEKELKNSIIKAYSPDIEGAEDMSLDELTKAINCTLKTSTKKHDVEMGVGGGVGAFFNKAKSLAKTGVKHVKKGYGEAKRITKKGVQATKKEYGKAKKYTKDKIHDHDKKVALKVIDATKGKVSPDSKFVLKTAEKIIKDKFDGGGEVGQKELMKENGITLLEGESTISGQIEARQKALDSVIKEIENPDRTIVLSMLERWKGEHEEALKKLNSIELVPVATIQTVTTKDGVEVEKGAGADKYKDHIFFDENGGKYECLGYFPQLEDCVYKNLTTGEKVVGCMSGFYFNDPTATATVPNQIPNNYEGKTTEQVWDEWTPEQRLHFLNDHRGIVKEEDKVGFSDGIIKTYSESLFINLDDRFRSALTNHIAEGQYGKGGGVPKKYDTLWYAQLFDRKDVEKNDQREFHDLTWKQAVEKAKQLSKENKVEVRLSTSKGFDNQGSYINAVNYGGGGNIPASPVEYFKALNLSALPSKAATYIKTEIITDNDIALLEEDDEEFLAVKDFVAQDFPLALIAEGFVEPEHPEPKENIVHKPQPVIELTYSDYEDALAGAETMLEYAEGKEKEDLQEYIDGLTIVLESMMKKGGETKTGNWDWDEFFTIVPTSEVTIDGNTFALDTRDGSEFLLEEEHDLPKLIASGDFLFGTEKLKRGGKIKKVKWIADALSGGKNKGALKRTAKRKGLIKDVDEKLSLTDLHKLEKVKGKTSKRAHLAETLREFGKGGDTSKKADKNRKALKPGERTSHKTSILNIGNKKVRRRNANQYGKAEGENDYVETRENRSDKNMSKKLKHGGGLPKSLNKWQGH